MPGPFELTSIVAKLALYFGVLTTAGLVMSRFVFAALLHDILPNIRRWAFALALLGAIAALASFALRGAMLTGDASGLTDPVILDIMWQTPVGTALVLRLAGLALVLLGLAVGGAGWVLALIGAGCAVWSFSVIGHVAGEAPVWAAPLLFVHLIAVAFWIGILAPLGRLSKTPDSLETAKALGDRFGLIAAVAIPLLAIAGFGLGWALVGSWGALFTTGYGITLVAKLGFVTVLLGLGALNKLHKVPRLDPADPATGQSLAKVLVVEWAVFALVLAATATLTTVLTKPMG